MRKPPKETAMGLHACMPILIASVCTDHNLSLRAGAKGTVQCSGWKGRVPAGREYISGLGKKNMRSFKMHLLKNYFMKEVITQINLQVM